MRNTKKRAGGAPAAAFFAAAAVWLIWALLFPMYRMWHFALPFAFSVLAGRGAFLLAKRRLPPEPEPEPEPEPAKKAEDFKPTGDPEVDAALLEGRRALGELGRLYASIGSPEVKSRVIKTIDITDRIVRDAERDRQDLPKIKKFLGFYIPATIRLLNEYDRMYSSGASGQNAASAMKSIEEALDRMNEAYERHYDSLFSNESLDIETDIKALEGLLKLEGLGGPDFEIK